MIVDLEGNEKKIPKNDDGENLEIKPIFYSVHEPIIAKEGLMMERLIITSFRGCYIVMLEEVWKDKDAVFYHWAFSYLMVMVEFIKQNFGIKLKPIGE